MPNRLELQRLFLLLAVLLLTVVAYWPGLTGGFLFDDFGNLPTLGANGPVDNWSTFWRYITSGIADPTGRPLTLLSFLINAHDWPAQPYPFKCTNLILHLLNGVLLYAVLRKLGQLFGYRENRSASAALAGSALWLLHPLLVSTTLYIVQREAMLPATCVLAGLLVWLHGRSQLANGKIVRGLVWTILGLGGFSVLGILAKANGALLCIYALLFEFTVLRPRYALIDRRANRSYYATLNLLATLPALGIITYLFWVGIHGVITGGPALRPWTYAQRLLTEPRVLLDYLGQLWLPRPYSKGLFNDQYQASTSWLHPFATLPAILVIAALLFFAWRMRRIRPELSLSIFFYFAGQLLESTSIPLELYFEHRNYVPAMLMFWPLGLWLTDARTLSRTKIFLTALLIAGLALMTHAQAEVWGDVKTQALIWARINPDSPRAQANAAQIEMQTGKPLQAIDRLEKLLAAQPNQAQIAFNLIGARCMTGAVGSSDIKSADVAMLATANTGSLVAHWFDHMIPVAVAGKCPGLLPVDLLGFIDAGLRNPQLAGAGPQQDLLYLRGRIELALHQPDRALANFTIALDLQVRPGMALQTAATLGEAGFPVQGLQLLDHYQQVQKNALPPSAGMPMIHEWVLQRENYWPREFSRLRNRLRLDANAASSDTDPPILDQNAIYR